MSSLFCCLASSVEDQRDSESINTTPSVCTSSPRIEDGCCCYRFIMAFCPICSKCCQPYRVKKVPLVSDAAVGTDVEFSVIAQDMYRGYNDQFGEGESFEETNMADHKYASLQFDAKPGKVRYVEGSQVFFVDVRDKKMAPPFRRCSVDKSISEWEMAEGESDASTDCLSDTKSDSQRRFPADSEAKFRRRSVDGQGLKIMDVNLNVSSPSTTDVLTERNVPNRVFLHDLEESHEMIGDTNLKPKDNPKETKECYNIDGGHFSRNVIGYEDEVLSNIKSYSRAAMSSPSHGVHSCIQVPNKKPERHISDQDFSGSEFGDFSNQLIQNSSQSSIKTTASSVSTDKTSVPESMFQESLYVHEVPKLKTLTKDPSGLQDAARINSMLVVNKIDQTIRESVSCPDLNAGPGSVNESSYSTVLSRENTLVSELTDTENEVCSVETQTDLLDKPAGQRPSMVSVFTETECGSQGTVQTDDLTGSEEEEEEKNNGSGSDNSGADNSGYESKHSDLSGSSSESASSTGSECGSTSDGSECSQNTESRHAKKTTESLHSDTSVSSCSSCPTSVREIDSVPYESKEPGEEHSNSKSSSADSSAGSASNTSSSNSISTSTSFSSDSLTGNRSDSTNEGCELDPSNSNG